ncbi:MAG: hypothetical protein MJ207_01735 [Bacilli bacterium]|nr:hypothetical protein [Bacilli bacterium]
MKNRKYLFALPIFALAGAGTLIGCGGNKPSSTLLLNAQGEVDDESLGLSIELENEKVFAGQAYETKITLIEKSGTDAGDWYELPSNSKQLEVSYGGTGAGASWTTLTEEQYTYEVDKLDHRTANFTIPKKVIDEIAKSKTSKDTDLWLTFEGELPKFEYGVVIEGIAPDDREDYEIDLSKHGVTPGGTVAFNSDLIFKPLKVHTPEKILELPTSETDFEVSVNGKTDKETYKVVDWNISTDDIDKGSITLSQACSTGNIVIKANLHESDPLLTFNAGAPGFSGEIELATDQVRKGDSYTTDVVLKQAEGEDVLELPAKNTEIVVTYVADDSNDPTPITDYVYERDAVDHTHARFSINASVLKDLEKGTVSIKFPELKPLQFTVSVDIQEKDDKMFYEVVSTALTAPAKKDFETYVELKTIEEPKFAKTLPENYYQNKDKIKFYVNDQEIKSFTKEEEKDIWMRITPLPGTVATADCKIPAQYITGNIKIVVSLVSAEK